jgi:competence transcription factor ComK
MRFFLRGNQPEDPENTRDERPRKTSQGYKMARKYLNVFLVFQIVAIGCLFILETAVGRKKAV